MATVLSSINTEYVDSISRKNNEPDWLAELRRQAFSSYEKLPPEVSPLYAKYSDVNLLKPESVQIPDGSDSSGKAMLSDDLKSRLEEVERETGALHVGASLATISVSEKVSKQGVLIMSLKDALAEHGELLRKHMTSNPLNYLEDRFLALEASAFQSGLFIYVPRDVILEDPIRIIGALAEDGSSLISRNVVVAETGSKAAIVQELYSPQTNNAGVQQAYFELVEGHVGPNAHLEMVTLQGMGGSSIAISNRKAFVDRDAKMSWYIGMFGAQMSRYRTDSLMKGTGSSAEDVEIVFGIGNQSFDVTSNLIHQGSYSRGRVLVKSVLKDTSKSIFKGMIKIGKDGKGTESYLAGHAVLLDKGAKSDSIPGLEIETNEVRATHSASVAQIDELQIFYLATRGLSREGAKREIVNGFLEPLSRKMGPTIRAWVNYLIENKWQGKPLMLKTDEAMEQILEVEKSRYRETHDLFEKHYKYR